MASGVRQAAANHQISGDQDHPGFDSEVTVDHCSALVVTHPS